MANLPASIEIKEEGPREGFQYEKGQIPTQRKIELIDALSQTGLRHIATVSFVDPRRVPGMADAEAVVNGMTPNPDVTYSALALNKRGLERALATGRVRVGGAILLVTTEAFVKINLNRSKAEQLAAQPAMIQLLKEHHLPIESIGIMAAFGCNYEGPVTTRCVLDLISDALGVAAEHDLTIRRINLADTMGWATPLQIKRLVGAVQDRFPEIEVMLHLHDTRGMGIANAFAGLEMGVRRFDAAVAGLGGCPFAHNKGAAGNVCTEDLVFMCEEMGVETGVDLDALIECAILAEDVVGHPLPGSVKIGGSLRRLREKLVPAA
ncbi:hydroxymethylglutaryl-CoA lyase [Bradyrhizobium mercantei]|uniref:hydroxymethylglutaryl-CoA lyase n=1 Tax=Bradyrhizobium mercantei TaxID=1904807 RepID=UPI0009756985|nr:hydroxymethylglutaryl-CoA lyase [Bradyrhizobium mercantei]